MHLLPLYIVCVERLLARFPTHIVIRLNVLTDGFANKLVNANMITNSAI